MGRDKALISIRGVPLIQHVCRAARDCAAEVYVVTPWPERYQDILKNDCLLIREMPSPGEVTHGPLIGFAQGLAQVQTNWVLVLACDLPQLRGSVLQEWARQLVDVPEKAIALLPRHAKGWEPLCGFYRRNCLPVLNAFINQGGKSFQLWLAQHTVQELPLTDPESLFNCNTPKDLTTLFIGLAEDFRS